MFVFCKFIRESGSVRFYVIVRVMVMVIMAQKSDSASVWLKKFTKCWDKGAE